MLTGQAPQKAGSPRGHLDQDAAAIRRIAATPDEPRFLRAIDEPDGALVLDLHPLGEVADGRRPAVRRTRNEEEQLVLSRRYALGSSDALGRRQEAAERVTPVGERPVVRLCQLSPPPRVRPHGSHPDILYIVLRYV